MRVALTTTKARFAFVGEDLAGVMVDGPSSVVDGEIVIQNYFLPVVGCDLVASDIGGNQFLVLNQVGLFEAPEGGLVLAPSKDSNNSVLVFLEIPGESVFSPKGKEPPFIKRLEFEDGEDSIFMTILERDKSYKIYARLSKKVVVYTLRYDYDFGTVNISYERVV